MMVCCSMGGQQHTPQSPLGEVAVPVDQQRPDPAQQPFFQVVGLGFSMFLFFIFLMLVICGFFWFFASTIDYSENWLDIGWYNLYDIVWEASVCELIYKSGLFAGEECKSGDTDGRLHSLPPEYSRYYILYSVFMVSGVCLNIL